ncbi:hypothetical protein Taro_027939 [Colocasia esculenta]|uniref:DUF4283 domain-containing protein n=1 Tax=Colocasia esculenta TaxID=4460 RepID=A0A843VVR6_COLES|nr:hypothetical protein [Colocasia esculenta]
MVCSESRPLVDQSLQVLKRPCTLELGAQTSMTTEDTSILEPPVVPVPVHSPATTDAGEPIVFFSSEEVKLSCKALDLAVIAKTQQGKPPFPDICNHLQQCFKLQHDFLISALDGRHLIIRFKNEEDYYKVLLKDTVDQNTSRMIRVDAEVVCVQLDVLKNLPDRVWVGVRAGGAWQPIVYPAPPLFCAACSRLGHATNNCRQSAPKKKEALAHGTQDETRIAPAALDQAPRHRWAPKQSLANIMPSEPLEATRRFLQWRLPPRRRLQATPLRRRLPPYCLQCRRFRETPIPSEKVRWFVEMLLKSSR